MSKKRATAIFDLSLRAGPVTTPALPKNGARETREKTRKRIRGVGWEAHITSRPDIERGRDALLRDPAWHVQKNVQRQYLTCPSELVGP